MISSLTLRLKEMWPVKPHLQNVGLEWNSEEKDAMKSASLPHFSSYHVGIFQNVSLSSGG
jgi:hypothetical protein